MKKIFNSLCIGLVIGFSTNALAGPNEDVGTVIGGIAGGLLGNSMGHGSGRAATTIGGAVIGSLVGNQIGSSADAAQGYGRHRCYRYNHWDRCRHVYVYPRYEYPRAFIGMNGRLCRRRVVLNTYGDRIYTTECRYRGPHSQWVRVIR